MRETADRSLTLRYVREILSCTNSDTAHVLNQLGRLDSSSQWEHWEATTKGNALAMPTAAAPLRLETAERFD